MQKREQGSIYPDGIVAELGTEDKFISSRKNDLRPGYNVQSDAQQNCWDYHEQEKLNGKQAGNCLK